MSHSDYLQFLRDQNKHLLQRLRVERLRAPWSVPVPPESGDGPHPTVINSGQNGGAADSEGSRNDRFEQGDASTLRNPNLKYQAHSELPGKEIEDDASQQPVEVVVPESPQRRAESRAALSTPSTHRAKNQGWTLDEEDGAGMELPDWLPDGEARAISSVERNCSSSIGLSPKNRLIPAETLGCERGKLKLEPRSTLCKLLTDGHVTKHFKCSTPFTKPPSAPRLTRQLEPPIPGQPSTGGTSNKGSSPMHHSHFLQTICESSKPRSKLEPPLYVDRLLDVGNDRRREQFIRDTRKPKSILLESRDKVAKADVGHVTFLSPNEESSLRAEVQSMQPFLGYDWIAGLIDIDSPMSEKSEEYFMELQNFRRVNKEECVHQEYMEAEELDVQVSGQEELDYNRQIHQCTHSYRVNSRLFAVPLEPAAACPVCKTPKSKRPHTMEDPAYIRVSIPRSTLLPPHKYKPHRRKSFDPTDSLSLPSHCLLGWESTMPSTAPVANTLDLRSTLEPKKPSLPLSLNLFNLSATVSRVAGGSRSDELLNLTRSTCYQFQRLRQDRPHSTSYPIY
ncbi:uncharacterized protein miip isoform X2 [Heterodontus francisci]|uniref:uncharacterized protein miip isoform X2 n=1 Tax=Heterodontus francisci TaxID=7792 RepID=UPI00355BAAA9